MGPSRARALSAEGIQSALDLVRLVPRGYVDRSTASSLRAVMQNLQSSSLWSNAGSKDIAAITREVSVVVTVSHLGERTVGRGRRMLQATVVDESGATAKVIFWNAVNYFGKLLSADSAFLLSGVPEYDARFNQVTFTHPEIEKIDAEEIEQLASGVVLPTYSISQKMRAAGVSDRLLRSMIDQVLDDVLGSLPEVLPSALLSRHGLLPRALALRYLHQPPTIAQAAEARRRLKHEELFYFQLRLAQRHALQSQPRNGLVMEARSPRARHLVESLPFELTGAQRRVIHEIVADMSSGSVMNRLLQGDVGSGKTIVALLCMLNVIDNGYQAVLMAPTEILAEQHYRGILRMLRDMDVVVCQVVGGQNKRQRSDVAERIASGEAQIIVGTHALFEANIEYNKLGLIVIDEQHRFGVAQRAELMKMGKHSHLQNNQTGQPPPDPHVLVMSATPIPRTLAMSVYGDLDLSVIDQLPANRKPIVTKVVFESGLPAAYEFIRSQVAEGKQAYLVYPLVEKSEKIEAKSAIEHFEHLSQHVFPELSLGLVHGQMTWGEKDQVMQSFLQRELQILVSTTVIEVGVDVSNATVMLVENAERFGLSQLHQLRGRVGRGADQSYCLLATKDHFQYQLKRNHSTTERANSVVRLRTMEETTDGFRIAEVDLELRGPGDVLGTRQSGLPEFTYANIVTDAAVLSKAREDAFLLIRADPTLSKPEHQLVKRHLDELHQHGHAAIIA
ncbi:MAG: ATP-dependent DNA helicase RecG [Bradyrhizobiaceae bacterium]|nr:ATP-dependent DNA helicase RecG [Bradyrhizobiaceae bacterium]